MRSPIKSHLPVSEDWACQAQGSAMPRPISLLILWISEGLTQAEPESRGVEFSCP